MQREIRRTTAKSETQLKPPTQLWKYRTWGPHAKAMVVEGDLYFAKAQELNDPQEYHWRERWPKNVKKQDVLLRDILGSEFPNDTPSERHARYEAVKKEAGYFAKEARRNDGYLPRTAVVKLGVFSVTEHWNHPLMWAHYADMHCGVCLCIDPSQVVGKEFHRVRYSKKPPVIRMKDYAYPSTDVFLDLSLRKSDSWSYESEWRTANPPGVKRYPGCITRIVVGVRASKEVRAGVLAAVDASEHKIELHDAVLSSDSYSIEAHPPIPI